MCPTLCEHYISVNSIPGFSTTYYSYDGVPIKERIVSYFNANSDHTKYVQGITAKTVAQNTINATLTTLGMVNSTFGLFLGGVSLLSVFESSTGVTVSGNTSDNIWFWTYYDLATKYTSCDWGYGYQISSITQKVRMIKTVYDCNFYTAGVNHPLTYTTYHSYEKASPYFTTPAPEAYLNDGIVRDETFTIELLKGYYLNFAE